MALAFAVAGWLIAGSGWIGFLFAEKLYRIERRKRSEDCESLGRFALAVVLSDDFRTAPRAG